MMKRKMMAAVLTMAMAATMIGGCGNSTDTSNAGVYVYNPATGATEKMSMTDAQNVFDAAGNVYFAYMKMAE